MAEIADIARPSRAIRVTSESAGAMASCSFKVRHLTAILGAPLCDAIGAARVEIDETQLRDATLSATVRDVAVDGLANLISAPVISIGERRPDDSGTVIGTIVVPPDWIDEPKEPT